MKCIRDKHNGIVTRIGDQEALNLVKRGGCEFVSKKVWREQTRDANKQKPMPDMASEAMRDLAAKVEPVPETVEPHVHLKSKERKTSRKKKRN